MFFEDFSMTFDESSYNYKYKHNFKELADSSSNFVIINDSPEKKTKVCDKKVQTKGVLNYFA